jgi:exosortase/archaeosortase
MSKKKPTHPITKKVGGQNSDPQPISATRSTLIVGASAGLTLFFYFISSAFPAIINIFSLATSAVASVTLNILGLDVIRHGTILQMSTFSFQLIPDCTPLPPALLLSGAMLAFPAYWKAKAIGISLGILI